MVSTEMSAYWPLFDLRMRTDRVELRYPTDAEVREIARVAAGGIHDPSDMPFEVPWTRQASPDLERSVLQRHWHCRAGWSHGKWSLMLAVVFEDRIVGCQTMKAKDFGVSRTVATTSWLGLAFQGNGLGREMRACVLALAFEGLGAEHAHSDVYDDTHASLRLNRKLGYTEHWGGVEEVERRPRGYQRFHLNRRNWESGLGGQHKVEIEGLEAAKSMFFDEGTTVGS